MEIENFAFASATSMSTRGSGVRRGSSKGGGNQGPACQRHINWEQAKVLALIQCKYVEHATQQQLIDPRAHMVPTAQHWNMIVDKLQKIVHAKILQNGKMCKDKWNGLNSNYKKL
jgi:hypothetical protein